MAWYDKWIGKLDNEGATDDGILYAEGDNGWNAFVQEVANQISQRVQRIILNSQSYSPTNGVVDLGAIQFAIDSSLSTTSVNAVRNSVITAAINALQLALDGKASSSELTQLSNIVSGLQEDISHISITSDAELSTTSENPVQNRVITASINEMREQLSVLRNERFGFARYSGGTIYFYDEDGGTVLSSVTLSGTIYNISIALNVDPIFSVLTGDTNKYITITPSTTAGALGEEGTAFPENYSYIVAIDTGSGYINRFNGNITSGGSATIDIRSFLAVGTNKVRISVTGTESGQTKTSILTATLTSLMLNCSHTWYTPWYENQDYVINNIYFSGSIQKTLHVKLGDTEWTKTYRANENYATIATNYTIPASAFPASSESGVYTVELWMTGEGVSTEHISFNIMCLQDGDTTPLICINNVATAAVNFTQATLFSFATINATSVEIASSVSADGTHVLPSQTLAVEDGQVYTFATALEVDTEAEDGTLTATATAYNLETEGGSDTVEMTLDNSLAFLAASGPVFYMNSALRANTEADRDTWRNTAPNAEETSYPCANTGFTNSGDKWATDPDGNKAFVIPAGCHTDLPTLCPFSMMGEQGGSFEFMIRSSNIADYDTPILTVATTNASNNVEGVIVYPTQIMVLGTQERSEVLQSCGLCEDSITHIMVVIQKNYTGIQGRNLVSVYINGIPNISFAYGSTSTFGTGGLSLGQNKTDFYFYMMRVYDRPLEGQDAKACFLNAVIDGAEFNRALIRDKDDILDGALIAYDLVKAKGYNIMVIEPDSDADDIPAFNNQTTVTSTVRFEYWGVDPLWNVMIKHVPVDGQGTTSKKYFRWNLRGKFSSACEWYYSDGNGGYLTTPAFTGKKGYMDGGSNGQAHLKIDRFTAKKNIASSPQGHKMGACAMYDELFAQMGIKNHMPNSNLRIAIWQYPFFGFRKYSNGTYEFIGLYTAGPDKGCKSTFGYDSDTYPACMCIEGPNHDPRGTRFLHPWVDVDFDSSEETLTFGGEEGWDGDYVGGLGTDDAADKAAVLALYKQEWRPAYDLVYHTSLWIDSLAATGYGTVEAINNNITTFLGGSTNGVSNMLLSFYDANYDIYYYRNKTGVFEKLVREDNDTQDGLWNILTYLDGYLTTSTPSTEQIKLARRAKFRAEFSNYFDADSLFAHRNFTFLNGAKDNDAKNSYPFKHLTLAQGGRWMLKQDDLDSILKTDNNGQGTVKYSVEPGDTVANVQIFQGSDSALWTMIWVEFQTELRNNMLAMCSAMETIARAKGIAGQYLHESVYNLMVSYYFDNSAKYFPMTAYQEDRVYGYITPWLIDPTQAYNSVYPLTQALGDRYQEERQWILQRIVYVFSKYRIGAFTGQNAGWGEMAFTLAANTPFTFNVTPAIDLYPVANSGGASTGDVQGARTMAGQTTQITLQSSGATTNYIKGVDWIQSLGDLSGLQLTSRGGSNEINFSVVSKRMQTLKVGDAVASNVLFNATSLTVSGECFEVIDARNVTTLNNAIDLGGCPRLRKALFGGSTATGMLLPVGARVDEVSFPESLPILFLHSLGSLTDANLSISSAALSTVQSYYFNRCAQLNPFVELAGIMDHLGNALQYVTMIWDGVLTITNQQVAALVKLSEGSYGCVNYDNGILSNDANTPPIIRGTVYIDGITEQDYDTLTEAYPNLTITYGQKYLAFEDQRVWEICCYNWGYTYDLQEVDGQGGVLDTGELEGNGDTMAYCDHIFACSTAIGAHGTVPATSARTVQYRLELVVEGGRALDGTQAPWDGSSATGTNSVFYPAQYSSAMAATALGNITSENWNAGATFWGTQTILVDDGMVSATARKYHAIITTTNAAQYLRLGIRAVAGTTISYKFVSVGVTKVPSGITSAQCAAVTSLSNKFTSNTLITTFKELRLFTSYKTIDDTVFRNCSNLAEVDFTNITSASTGSNFFAYNGTKLSIIKLPNLTIIPNYSSRMQTSAHLIFGDKVTRIGRYAFYDRRQYIVIKTETPPSIVSGTSLTIAASGTLRIYVPDDAVDTYKASTVFSSVSSYIRAISEYPYPDDLT